ncbi:thiolase family protein [Actinomadura madurae]|uniref:thiolase family protein n=1 Tax=Actinomadura madurae TaxID=1993 RepID=UPI0020261640|nr:thiolase family protein [Actinomadura madurae]URM99973.1 thiolase family protein [Actinomadura madurae]URN02140.1 thiolase family protein [Actinomadura madurae]
MSPTAMSETVWVAGVGMTPFGVHADRSFKDLACSAVSDALADAGAVTGDIEVALFGTTTQGPLGNQHMVAGQIALREMGVQRIPVYNVENACATGASAFSLAVSQLRSGASDVALAVGVEKMSIGDPERTMAVFDGAYDVSDREGLDRTLALLGGDVDEPDLGRRSIFMDIYAAMARNHMRLHGTTQRQIAAVSAKNHRHAVGNRRAHYRTPLSVDEVLAARRLSYPLTVPMCAPVTDGGAAAVLCNARGLRRLRGTRPVKVLAAVVGTGTDRDVTSFDGHIGARVAERAYQAAGVGPEDVSVAEVHDATAFAEILQTELLGLVPAGDGGPAAEAGVTALGGRVPVNPSGGLQSKGHPLAATGLGQIFELAQQLRGEAGARQVERARIALAENGGGFHRGEEAVTAVTILGNG